MNLEAVNTEQRERLNAAAEPLSIVLWQWRDPECRVQYTAEDVNICARMIERHLTIPHRFICFTDDVRGEFDDNIEARPLWNDFHLLKTPLSEWRREFPQNYVRLFAFSDKFKDLVGPRYASIDLDCVVLGDLDPLFSRSEDFLIWRKAIVFSTDRQDPYNCSLWMMDTGARPQVWRDFRGIKSLQKMPPDYRFHKTDQGWMLYKLGLEEPGWTKDDGVYEWKWLVHKAMRPPKNARIVFFNGKLKPRDYFWIRDNYR